MDESTQLLSALYLITSQMQNVKDKLDPQVYELLNRSGHEAIASAHHFLDACEKALDSLIETSSDHNEEETKLTDEEASSEPTDNIVELNIAQR